MIHWSELESRLFTTNGRRYLFVDTCHAKGAFNATFSQNAYRNDVTAFSAVSQETQALELQKLKHGLFAYAVMQGLAGEADTDGSRVISVKKLGAYLPGKAAALMREHYPDYKGAAPVPQLAQSPSAGDHVLGVLGR